MPSPASTPDPRAPASPCSRSGWRRSGLAAWIWAAGGVRFAEWGVALSARSPWPSALAACRGTDGAVVGARQSHGPRRRCPRGRRHGEVARTRSRCSSCSRSSLASLAAPRLPLAPIHLAISARRPSGEAAPSSCRNRRSSTRAARRQRGCTVRSDSGQGAPRGRSSPPTRRACHCSSRWLLSPATAASPSFSPCSARPPCGSPSSWAALWADEVRASLPPSCWRPRPSFSTNSCNRCPTCRSPRGGWPCSCCCRAVAATALSCWPAPLRGSRSRRDRISHRVLLGLLPLVLHEQQPTSPARRWPLGAARVGWFAVGLSPAVVLVACFNTVLYGAPWASGYGDAGQLFSPSNIVVNVQRYGGWLVETHAILLVMGVAGAAVLRAGARDGRQSATGLALALAIVLVCACYVAYAPFESWTYLRFLLLAVAGLAILAGAAWSRTSRALPHSSGSSPAPWGSPSSRDTASAWRGRGAFESPTANSATGAWPTGCATTRLQTPSSSAHNTAAAFTTPQRGRFFDGTHSTLCRCRAYDDIDCGTPMPLDKSRDPSPDVTPVGTRFAFWEAHRSCR